MDRLLCRKLISLSSLSSHLRVVRQSSYKCKFYKQFSNNSYKVQTIHRWDSSKHVSCVIPITRRCENVRGTRTLASAIPNVRSLSTACSTASGLQVELVPCLRDNYSFLLHDPASGVTAAVDPADSASFERLLEERGLGLDLILNTHHHADHTGGNEVLKWRYGAKIVGPLADKDRIPGLDIALKDGDTFQVGSCEARVFDTPGHTRGHIVFWMPNEKVLFVGDTLFVLGCGRLFEGSAEQMFASLAKLKDLDPETEVYCAHEYSQENARFCLSLNNPSDALIRRAQEITRLREKGIPTVPTTIGAELETNPFLRAETAAEFAVVRKAKDKF